MSSQHKQFGDKYLKMCWEILILKDLDYNTNHQSLLDKNVIYTRILRTKNTVFSDLVSFSTPKTSFKQLFVTLFSSPPNFYIIERNAAIYIIGDFSLILWISTIWIVIWLYYLYICLAVYICFSMWSLWALYLILQWREDCLKGETPLICFV